MVVGWRRRTPATWLSVSASERTAPAKGSDHIATRRARRGADKSGHEDRVLLRGEQLRDSCPSVLRRRHVGGRTRDPRDRARRGRIPVDVTLHHRRRSTSSPRHRDDSQSRTLRYSLPPSRSLTRHTDASSMPDTVSCRAECQQARRRPRGLLPRLRRPGRRGLLPRPRRNTGPVDGLRVRAARPRRARSTHRTYVRCSKAGARWTGPG